MTTPRRTVLRGAALLSGAPAGYQTPTMPGTAPGPAAGIIRARLVIVSGTAGGVFVYAGTPALGNPPIFWATAAAVDPFGNVIPSTSGVAASGTFTAGNTITNANGIVAYSSAPAAGKMVFSDAPAAFTDSSGNKVLAGLTAYTSGNAINIGPGPAAPLTWYSGTQTGGWTAGTAMSMQVVNQLSVFCNAISQVPVTGSGISVVSYNLPGVLQLGAQSSTPSGSFAAGAANLYADGFDYLRIQNPADSTVYVAGKNTAYNTALQTFTSATPVVIGLDNPLQWNVQNGVFYYFKMFMVYTGAAAAGTPIVGFNGSSSITQVNAWAQWWAGGAAYATGTYMLSTFSNLTGPTLTTGNNALIFEGWGKCTGSGTFNIRAQTNGTNNWSMKGAAGILEPV